MPSHPQTSQLEALQVALQALQGLEEVLLAQEEALEQAQLLRPEALQGKVCPSEVPCAEDPENKDKIRFFKAQAEPDSWTSRWRLLQAQTELRSHRWRLLRERSRSAALERELEIRTRHGADLQRQLEAAQAELALLKGGGERQSSSPRRSRTTKSAMVKMKSTPALHEANERGMGTEPDPSSSPRKRPLKSQTMVKMKSTPVLDGEREQGESQLKALREAQCALRGENLELKQELVQQKHQMAAQAADLAALEVRVSAKSHEAQIKDALLKCLQKEAWHACEHGDDELQKTLSAVTVPLLGALRAPPTLSVPITSSGTVSPAVPSHFSSICVLPGMPAPMVHPHVR